MKFLFLISIFISNILCNAQDFKKCIVYEFSGKDSSKQHIALTKFFNNNGKVVSETYSNYHRSIVEGNSDGTYYYSYNDTLITSIIFINLENDTLKILKHYNNNNYLVKEEHYVCEKQLRKDTIRTWSKTNEINLIYDTFGRLIKRDEQNVYQKTWKYDNENKIIQECGYDNGKLKYKEEYNYFNGGYKYSTIYYDNNGIPEKPEYTDIIFNPIFTTTFYLDRNGQIIKEEITTENGIKINNETTYYNNAGKIVKTINQYFDKHYISSNGQTEITHIFEYK